MSRDAFPRLEREYNEREERLDEARASIKEHDELMRLRESRAILLSALLGVRGMAEIESRTGSGVWKRAVEEIDRCVAEAGFSMTPKIKEGVVR